MELEYDVCYFRYVTLGRLISYNFRCIVPTRILRFIPRTDDYVTVLGKIRCFTPVRGEKKAEVEVLVIVRCEG